MEIKINKEIKNYKESIFFGLSLRQFFCVVISCILAVISYFLFKNKLGLEITSWICIIVSLPFIFIGFVKYNGMNFEDVIKSFIYSKFFVLPKLGFKSESFFSELYKQTINNQIRNEVKNGKTFFKKQRKT